MCVCVCACVSFQYKRISEKWINTGKKSCDMAWLVIMGCLFLFPSRRVLPSFLMASLEEDLTRQACHSAPLMIAGGGTGGGEMMTKD